MPPIALPLNVATGPAGISPNQLALQNDLADLNAQKTALNKYGLTDTTQLARDNSGNYVPKPTPPPGAAGTAGGPPTVGDIYGGVYSPDKNATAMTAAEKAASGDYNPGDVAPVQEDSYNTALNEYQDQIDAINNLYATKRAEVTKQYSTLENARLGSEGALLANTGMAGSTFGTSKTSELGTANENELKAAQDQVDAEKQAAIASIMGGVRQQASKDYSDKLAAYTGGAEKSLQFLKDSATRNETNATSVAQNSLLKGLDLSDPKNFEIVKNIAQTMGVDPNFIIDKYKTAKAAYDQAQVTQKATNDKNAADLAKTIQETATSKASAAETKANTAKIYSDIANGGLYQSAGLKIGKNDLSDIQNALKNGNAQKGLLPAGKDGYANTPSYLKLYNYWVNQGGLAKDFISLFPPKTYLNPNDPTLPDQLKEAIKAPTFQVNTIPGVTQ